MDKRLENLTPEQKDHLLSLTLDMLDEGVFFTECYSCDEFDALTNYANTLRETDNLPKFPPPPEPRFKVGDRVKLATVEPSLHQWIAPYTSLGEQRVKKCEVGDIGIVTKVWAPTWYEVKNEQNYTLNHGARDENLELV